ncbi:MULTISPECIES: response regulator transcription factor [unclassified Mameliella]|uniref:response regulator transcription factor n=1 Tax=unclassified Mameliella TaxID=2630630 RepID=UPI00273FD75D|nr:MULTISPECIES: helix-turn-helix transcriptional regulator [unclassified Mameliella]
MSYKMEDRTIPGTTDLLAGIDTCLALAGRDAWADAFVPRVAATGAAQVMVFSYREESAACLLSRNFRSEALGPRLAEDYLGGWYRQDPLFRRALALETGALEVIESGAVIDEMTGDYRAWFYDRPGLEGKTAVLVRGNALCLAVNFYWPEAQGAAAEVAIRVLARLALLHFESRAESGYPAPLAVLSQRERDVCLGILSGKKAEVIAGELGVAVSTIATYRTRAYEKLGISSRGSLFALCRV